MALHSPAARGLTGRGDDPGTSGRGDASWSPVALRGRASMQALALVVMTTAACSADEPAAPPATAEAPADAPAPAGPPAETISTPTAEPRRSLVHRIAPLLVLPSLEPIAEGFPAVGVASCDQYLRNYLRCVEQTMPAQSVEAIRRALMESGRSWAELRQGPGGADAVAAACATAEEAGRTLVSSLGCTWE
ncbi:MAG: hypothetical protein KDK70_30520 [Myxococcales bacterium]|nr:hypothetical protein [Myxococcales bacterium]